MKIQDINDVLVVSNGASIGTSMLTGMRVEGILITELRRVCRATGS